MFFYEGRSLDMMVLMEAKPSDDTDPKDEKPDFVCHNEQEHGKLRILEKNQDEATVFRWRIKKTMMCVIALKQRQCQKGKQRHQLQLGRVDCMTYGCENTHCKHPKCMKHFGCEGGYAVWIKVSTSFTKQGVVHIQVVYCCS
jgi:hypothetical protein